MKIALILTLAALVSPSSSSSEKLYSSSSSSSSSNYLLDPLRLVGIDGDRRAERRILSMAEVSLRGFWNSSWPSIVRRRIETELQKADGGTGRGGTGIDGTGFGDTGLGGTGRDGTGLGDRSSNISSSCSEDLVRLAVSLFRRETWAFKMVDASGKLPSGLLLGNIQWIGSYAECIGVSSNLSFHSSTVNRSSIMGGYCLMNIGDGSSMTAESMGVNLRLGICLPRTCNSNDAKALINILLIGFTNTTYATGADCTDDSTLPLDAGASVFIVILCVFGVLLLLGTCLDVMSGCRTDRVVNESVDDRNDRDADDDPLIDDVQANDHSEVIVQSIGTQGVSTEALRIFPPVHDSQPGCLYRFLIAFSIVANTKKIFSTEISPGNRPLLALHGIRFLSMTWVILGHTYLFTLTNTSNMIVYLDYLKRFTFQTVLNASVSVDTFFLLSGTLVSYFLLKEIKSSEGPHNTRWAKFFFHRFWRLTPLYMMVLAFYTTLFKYFGSGPYWPRTSDKNCQANWWTDLLYINNIVRTETPCMGWTWYLANDMQFFLLSPLFIVLLYKWALLGYIAISIFMLASFITTGVITSVNQLPPSIPGIAQNVTLQDLWFHNVYITPWCRISPYLVGIVLGYVLYRTNFKLKLPLGLVVLFWLLAAVCNLSVLYGLWNVSRGYPLSSAVNALYASLHRTAWAIGVAWVILACATGNGGFINDLLSLPVMFPLSRLTYAAYLVHPIVLSWYFLNQKVPLYVDDGTMVFLFVANLAFSYVSAFVASVIFESPLIDLEKSFIRDRKSLEPKT